MDIQTKLNIISALAILSWCSLYYVMFYGIPKRRRTDFATIYERQVNIALFSYLSPDELRNFSQLEDMANQTNNTALAKASAAYGTVREAYTKAFNKLKSNPYTTISLNDASQLDAIQVADTIHARIDVHTAELTRHLTTLKNCEEAINILLAAQKQAAA